MGILATARCSLGLGLLVPVAVVLVEQEDGRRFAGEGLPGQSG